MTAGSGVDDCLEQIWNRAEVFLDNAQLAESRSSRMPGDGVYGKGADRMGGHGLLASSESRMSRLGHTRGRLLQQLRRILPPHIHHAWRQRCTTQGNDLSGNTQYKYIPTAMGCMHDYYVLYHLYCMVDVEGQPPLVDTIA